MKYRLIGKGIAALSLTLCAGSAVFGQANPIDTKDWVSSNGSNRDRFNFDQNWSSKSPPDTNDIARFGFVGTLSLTPTVTAIQEIGGITFAGTQSFTLGGSSTLTIGSSGITNNGTASHTINAPLTLSVAQTWNAASGNLTFGGTVSLANNVTLLTIAGAANTTINGVISGTGALTKDGTGTLSLTGANTYTGTTTIGASNGVNAGTLQLSGSGKISNAATTVYGGTLDLNGTTQTISTLTLGGGAAGSTAQVTLGSGTLNLGGNVSYSATNNPSGATISGSGTLNLNGNRTFTVGDSSSAAVDLTVSAKIANGSGSPSNITKDGTGTLSLTGANSYTGTTTINAGTLRAEATGALGNGTTGTASITVNSGGTLLLAGGVADRVKDTAPITLAGGTLATSGVQEGSTTIVGLGALTLTTDSVLDFQSTGGLLHFAASNSSSWGNFTLRVNNWTPGSDALYFGTNANGLTSVQLGKIQFFDSNNTFLGSGAIGSDGNITAVPEPSTILAGIGLVGMIGYRERRRIKSLITREPLAAV